MNIEPNFHNNILVNEIQTISNPFIKNLILNSQRNLNNLYDNLKSNQLNNIKKEKKKKKEKKNIKFATQSIKYLNPKIEKFIPSIMKKNNYNQLEMINYIHTQMDNMKIINERNKNDVINIIQEYSILKNEIIIQLSQYLKTNFDKEVFIINNNRNINLEEYNIMKEQIENLKNQIKEMENNNINVLNKEKNFNEIDLNFLENNDSLNNKENKKNDKINIENNNIDNNEENNSKKK